MRKRILLTILVIASLGVLPSAASAQNKCFSQFLRTAGGGYVSPTSSPYDVIIDSLQSHPRPRDIVHMQLQIQRWNGTAWEAFVTDEHSMSYARQGHQYVSRTWTLHENYNPIREQAEAGTPMRISATMIGRCGGSMFKDEQQRQLIAPLPVESSPGGGI